MTRSDGAGRLGAELGLVLATALAAVSLFGIVLPGTYARETTAWAAQAIGQDWFDLVVAVPWLVVTARWAERGHATARLVFAGSLLYGLYELVIYAFGLHFNVLFLLYCGALGVALLTLMLTGASLVQRPPEPWPASGVPVKSLAGLLFGTGALFGFLWLAEILPAMVHGATPASIAAAALPVNPVHVMDLSAILPAYVAAAALLLQRRRLGEAVATILLAFGFLMAASIAGMMLVMRLRGAHASSGVIGGLAALALTNGLLLARVVRATTGRRPAA
ncbi:MAG: hypothetical protein ACJ8F1_00930 [Polyangia bacterium]